MKLPIQSRFRVIALTAALAIIYYAAARFGQLVAIPPGNVTAVWFPSGIALAFLVIFGYRLWPGIWLGAFPANTWAFFDASGLASFMESLLIGASIATGASLGALLGAYLLNRCIKSSDPCARGVSVFRFAFLCGAVSSAVSATVGASSLGLGGMLDTGSYWLTYITWWLGDTTGILVMTPVLLCWWRTPSLKWAGGEMIEIGVMMFLLALSGWFVFGDRLQGVSATLMLAYGALSVLTWSAVRFTPRETATAAFILSVIALLGYSRYSGIFALHLGLENILMFQGLVGLVSMTSLGLAGEFSFRRSISKALINYRAASLQTADHWMITDCKGRIIEVNPSFEKISGYSAKELIGKSPSILKSGRHDKSYYGEMWRSLISGKTYKGLTINKKKSGEMFFEIKTISPIKNEHGKITRYLSIAKDITDLKHSEDQLEITKKEFESAGKIQQRLFPLSTPKPPGIEIAGASKPAVATGGDYFDYFALDSGDIILVIGDVTGHGFGPALLMASVRAYLRALAFKEPNILKVITSLNELIISDTDEETFVTLMLARLDPEMRTIKYVSAGHVTCYVLDHDYRVKTAMESSGLPLGVYGESSFGPSRRADLENGDMVLLITDGMLEAENSDGSPFELERVFASVRASRGCTALDIVERLHKDVLDYCGGECADDITSIAVKIGLEARGA